MTREKHLTASEAHAKNKAWAVGPLVLDTPSCPDGRGRHGIWALPRVPLSLACYGSSGCCRCRRAARLHAVQVQDYFNRYGYTMPNEELLRIGYRREVLVLLM